MHPRFGTPQSKTNLRKIAIIFLSTSLNMCFGCSKEPSHRDGSFEYSQHMFWLRNKKNTFQLRTLVWGPAHRQADIRVIENVQRRAARYVNNDYTTRTAGCFTDKELGRLPLCSQTQSSLQNPEWLSEHRRSYVPDTMRHTYKKTVCI